MYAVPDSYLHSMARRENYSYKRSVYITISGSSHRKTGTGKSHTALRYGEQNDKEFREGIDPARKVVYNIADVMKIIAELEADYSKAPRRTIGQTLIIDEAGSMISSTAWQQATNKAVKYIVETCRYLRIGFLLVMPQRRSIDKSVRTMADYHISMKMTMNNNGKVMYLSTPYAMYYDEFKDETYRRKLFGYGREGSYANRLFPLKGVPVAPIQNPELVASYEKKQIKYKMLLRELMEQDINSYEKKLQKDPSLPQVEEIANKIFNDEELLKSVVFERKIDKNLLAVSLVNNFPGFNFSDSHISTIARIVNKVRAGRG